MSAPGVKRPRAPRGGWGALVRGEAAGVIGRWQGILTCCRDAGPAPVGLPPPAMEARSPSPPTGLCHVMGSDGPRVARALGGVPAGQRLLARGMVASQQYRGVRAGPRESSMADLRERVGVGVAPGHGVHGQGMAEDTSNPWGGHSDPRASPRNQRTPPRHLCPHPQAQWPWDRPPG